MNHGSKNKDKKSKITSFESRDEISPLVERECPPIWDGSVDAYERTIVAEFFPSGETVRMVVTLDPMHDEQTAKMQMVGFISQLSKLDWRFGEGQKLTSLERLLASNAFACAVWNLVIMVL